MNRENLEALNEGRDTKPRGGLSTHKPQSCGLPVSATYISKKVTDGLGLISYSKEHYSNRTDI